MSNPTAAILVIGDEILSGRTKDKNIGWLAEELTGLGIQLVEARVIADVKQTIIRHVQELSSAYDYVFTSGGIGPTHDDITTDCVAAAFDKQVSIHPEAWDRLIAHYKGTDIEFNAARQRMARIPEGATLIDNPVSAAPGFILENVHVMAGVPSIMQATFSGLAPGLAGGVQPTRITVQVQTGEGNIAAIMADITAEFNGVSVGSYPWFKPGQFGTAMVLTGLDNSQVAQAAETALHRVQQAGFSAAIDG